jgi:hypothetical protein
MAIIINEKKNVLKTWQAGLACIRYNFLGPKKRFVICPGGQINQYNGRLDYFVNLALFNMMPGLIKTPLV